MSFSFVLSVRNLKKIYPGKMPFTAVNGVSFDLASGEILGLLGPNGAGKTTIIQMLLSTLKPSGGSITYFGKDFAKYRSQILEQVVFASTYVSVPWMLTVSQNLKIFSRLYGIEKKEIEKRMDFLLERFGMLEKKDVAVSHLSSGQITRLMLIKAFIKKPKIVLLDEPTASLDPDVAQDVCNFVMEERKRWGTSILFTSHNMAEVSQVCDRILFIQRGQIIVDDTPERLAKSVAKARLQLIIASSDMEKAVSLAEKMQITYSLDNRHIEFHLEEKQIAFLLHVFAKDGVSYTHINVVHPTLEDYFLYMVQQGRLSALKE